MKFNLTVDKKVEASIDPQHCINCGNCGDICPTGAIQQYQKIFLSPFDKSIEKKYKSDGTGRAEEMARTVTCSMGCPLGITPQSVIDLIKEGHYMEAYGLIDEKNPLADICSMVCPGHCMTKCKREVFLDKGINMPALERYVLNKRVPRPYESIGAGYEKVAVIGSGPAGLVAALDLNRAGYRVTIFEKDNEPGGAMRWGIPAFRLDKEKMRNEVDRILNCGIEIRYGQTVGETISIEDIMEEGFTACLMAVGASYGVISDIDGAEGEGSYDAVELLRAIANGSELQLGEKVAVIGRGELATDVARILSRMDKDVFCALEDDPESYSVSKDTCRAMEEEGITFRMSVIPNQIIRENGRIKAVELSKAGYIEDDEGQVTLRRIKGTESNVFCDCVIFASERKVDVQSIATVETYPNGNVRINNEHRTNKGMLFACGDAVSDSRSVVEAMASGRQAAIEIDRQLQQRIMFKKEKTIRTLSDQQVIYAESIAKTTPVAVEKLVAGVEIKDIGPVEDITPLLEAAGMMGEVSAREKSGGNKMIAVAGGGIAGITAALVLSRKGYRVTIFEKTPRLGGRYAWLATDKRIDKRLLQKQLRRVEDADGIRVVYNASVGLKPTIEELKAAGYEAVLMAIGESAGRLPETIEDDTKGVFEMINLMKKLPDGEVISGIGRKIMIMGSDEMSIDLARKLKTQCEEVTLLAHCSRGGLQVVTAAVDQALQEGVNIVTGLKLSRINSIDGILDSIDCRILENNLSLNIPCDSLIIGDSSCPDTDAIAVRNPQLKIDDRGYFVTDDKLQTSIEGVFALGDFDMSAADAGKAGAAAVEGYMLRDEKSIAVVYKGEKTVDVKHEIIEGVHHSAGGIEIGKKLWSDAEAFAEASRCMDCGYHKEESHSCMGCGLCASVCSENAIKLAAIDEMEEGGRYEY